MKLLLVAVILLLGLRQSCGDDKYYVQLIKGTDERELPKEGARAVGISLGKRLAPLRWKYYWEVERHDIMVGQRKPSTVHLGGKRVVDITLQGEDKVEVRLYRDKRLSRKSRDKVCDRMMAIFGGDDEDSAWFVVVRRKEPRYYVVKR